MKKKICIFLIIFMLFLSMTNVFAADTFATSVDLWTKWQNDRQMDYDDPEPYPEYITGVWTDDNMATLTFGVTKDERGEAGKEEILAMVEDDSTVKFTYQSYPYNELWAIQLELQERMGEATGAYAMGIHEMENKLRIDIDKNNENADAFIDECFAKYGDRVIFEQSDGITIVAESGQYVDAAGGKSKLIWIGAVVVMLIAAAMLFMKAKPRFMAQTTAGTTAETDEKLTAQQTEALIKDFAEAPDDAVYERIREEIGKK